MVVASEEYLLGFARPTPLAFVGPSRAKRHFPCVQHSLTQWIFLALVAIFDIKFGGDSDGPTAIWGMLQVLFDGIVTGFPAV